MADSRWAANAHWWPFSEALAAAAKVYASDARPACLAAPARASASSQRTHFSHELIAALKITALSFEPPHRAATIIRRAQSHCAPFSHALTVASCATRSGWNATSFIHPRSSRPRSQSELLSHALNAELQLMTSGSRVACRISANSFLDSPAWRPRPQAPIAALYETTSGPRQLALRSRAEKRNSTANAQRPSFSQALMEALYVTTSTPMPATRMSTKWLNARSHWWPLSHALTAALQPTMSSSSRRDLKCSRSRAAPGHLPAPWSAETAAL
mmetsp:Transcript_97057/g.274298  ORF Transcript_97057/g.274298 Transcript_97057/m.274298 type:complete len:272 (+) Transcript_97057:563-1378(+)